MWISTHTECSSARVTEARVMSEQGYHDLHVLSEECEAEAARQTARKAASAKSADTFMKADELPEDFICPLCKHGAVDFEPIEG